tara:strand:+ start:86 stop:481 length:396 start_codon:yes stop_codon:yes gene_type:complete
MITKINNDKLNNLSSLIDEGADQAFQAKQELDDAEGYLNNARDYINDTENYFTDISTEIEGLKNSIQLELEGLERLVIGKAVIHLIKMLAEEDREFAVTQVREYFQTKKEETQEMKTPAAKSTTEETTEEV